MPQAPVIPILVYEDVNQAADWLRDVFGFTLHMRIGNHHAQLAFGDGAIMLGEQPSDLSDAMQFQSHSLLIRVEDVDHHFERAKKLGARIVKPPQDYPYGERQYTVIDIGGHEWTFSESIDDVNPDEWGGTLVPPI